MSAPLAAYFRALRDRNLTLPDTPAHRTACRRAEERAETELECREVEAEGWEWEPWETANGIML